MNEKLNPQDPETQKKLNEAVEMVRTGIGAESLIMIAHFEGCKMLAAGSGRTMAIVCTLSNLDQVKAGMTGKLMLDVLEMKGAKEKKGSATAGDGILGEKPAASTPPS